MTPVLDRHRTLTFDLHAAPLVVDVWEPQVPTDNLPLLLIHGWGGTGSYWHPTAERLSQTNRVIVPDLPGTGRSQPVSRTQNLYDQVNTLVDLLDLMELERVQVVGHSMGATMALLLADERPAQVERLILTSMNFFMDDTQKQVYRAAMLAFRPTFAFRPAWLADVAPVRQAMAARYFHRVPDDEAVLRQGMLDFLQLHAPTAITCAENVTDDRLREAGSRVKVPTLLIVSRQDTATPAANVNYTAEVIPNCTVHWIEECGHLPMVEKPDEYLSLLRDFLDLSIIEGQPS